MTIDIPADSPKGNIITTDLNDSFEKNDREETENLSNITTSEPKPIPVVILKKLEDDDKYYVVSPRSSNRPRTVKSFQGFEMDLSPAKLTRIGEESVSPRKRGRPKKTDGDFHLSPKKIQKKTQEKSNYKKDHMEDLCTSLKDTVKLITPVKKYINSISDDDLTENYPSSKNQGTQEKTPVKNTPRSRGRPKLLDRDSPMKTDQNELVLSEKRQIKTPKKYEDTRASPVRSAKINLDQSFRRSVLKSTLNLDNVQKETEVHARRSMGVSVPKKSSPKKLRRRTCQSYTSMFFYDDDSDDYKEKKLTNQSDKVGSAKRRIFRSRSNSTSCKVLNVSDEDYFPATNEENSKSNSYSISENDTIREIVLPKTPNRRKQVLRPRRDLTSNDSKKFSLSPERTPQKGAAKTPRTHRTRKDSVPSSASDNSPDWKPQKKAAKKSRTHRTKKNSATSSDSDKSPERKPSREVARTPKTPRNRRTTAVTPRSVMATPKTPKNRLKLLRDGIITPSMHSRSSMVQGDSTPLMKARSQLHVSFVPTSLPCREKEYLDVYQFLRGKLDDGCGGCMYISGVPGTGKTATVTSVIDHLQHEKKVPKFSYVSVNGMRLTEPRQSYVEIWKQLTGKTIPWEQAQGLLEERFTKMKRMCPVVMLIDELDILCTKRQDVVYNLLDWPTKSKDQLIVITIANTMDLPERLLMSRVTSRLGLTRLTFQAYTHKQLMEIVTKRLTGTDSFNPDAIQLVARKVASVSGDARRALDICRRAAEIAEDEGKGQLVNIIHINEALNAMITQPQVMAIRRCSRLQKLLLQAIVAEIERTGVEETTFSDVFRILVSCCALDGFKMVSSTAAQRALCELSAYRLIITDQKCSHIFQRIILNVSVHDVYFALKKE